jgi:hypothetical protein
MNTADKSDLIWQCVGYEPTEWVLGVQVGKEMKKIRASVRRLDDGSWRWESFLFGGYIGTQPSRETAIAAAEASILQKL